VLAFRAIGEDRRVGGRGGGSCGGGLVKQLLAQLAGNQMAGFILVLARVTPLFFLAPLFSSQMIPPRVRGLVAVAISIGLAPVALHGQHVPSDALSLAGLVLEGLLVGFGFAFALAALMAAVESAGALADVLSGFSFGALLDPIDGNQGGVLLQFYSLVGTLIFLAIGGDAWVLRGLARTFQLVPLTQGPQISSLVGGAEHVFSGIFAATLEIAAPVVIALLITDVAFGVVSRVVPQLSVFAVGFPAKVVVALLLVGASLPFVSGWLSNEVSTSVGAALGALHVA
jgi:flagellar biosynthetic protein FliR